MSPAIYIAIFLPLIMLAITRSSQRRKIIAKKIINRRSKKENNEMLEMAKRFVDKECILYLYDGNQVTGILKEVSDGAALVDKSGTLEAINLDFVTRIREYPKGKNGKKKSVVLD